MDSRNDSQNEIRLEFDLEGMIDIFGRAVFSSPLAVVRELIQNAHDACVLRENDDPKQKARSSVRVSYAPFSRELVVTDNGKGMTEHELREQFSLLGKSDKRRLRSNLTHPDFGTTRAIIGEFGIGLLSALAVGESVTLTTRSASADGPALEWKYRRGQETATFSHVDSSASGTTITVVVDERYSGEFTERKVVDAVRKYVALLPIPIECNDSRINEGLPLWNQPDRATTDDWAKYIKEREGAEPLHLVSLCEASPELHITGVLFIPKRARLFVQGQLDVYVRRMFVRSDRGDLLPSWAAGFAQGYINSNTLQRTASGENVAHDKAYERCAEFLAQSIATLVGQFISEDSAESRNVLRQFDDQIKSGAAQSDFLWQRIWDQLLFRVGDELWSIPEYLEECSRLRAPSDTVYFYEDENDHAQATVVRASTGIPVVNAVYGVDKVCLRCWERGVAVDDPSIKASEHNAEDTGTRRLATLSELASERFEETDDPRWTAVVELFQRQEIECLPKSFQPAEVPAVLVRSEGFSSDLDKLESVLGGEVDDRFLKHLIRRARSGLNPGTTLFLNTNNPEVQRLLDISPADPILPDILLCIYNNAFMFTHRNLRENEVGKILKTNNRILRHLLRQRHPRAGGDPEQSVDRMSSVSRSQGECAVIFTDLSRSTWMLANIQLEKHADVFAGYISELQKTTERLGGKFCKFTGDGALLFFPLPDSEQDATALASVQCAREIPVVTLNYFSNEPIRSRLRENGLEVPRVRTALAVGHVSYLPVGGALDVVGRAVVQAQRICETKELFDAPGTVICTTAVASAARLDTTGYETIQEEFRYEGGPPVQLLRLS